ncbi:unnamed protein product, partial [Cyprideis torosa]
CFSLGNLRVNENAGQVSLATILLREHNRIASTLSLYNPHWTDERAFQEARRILVAQIQHITFNEFLYTILDETLYEKSGLAVTTADYFTGYSSDVHPGIANSVGASVIGFVSTMFPLNITIVNTTTGETQMLRADSGQYNPSLLRNQGDLDSLLLGLVRSRSSNVGPTFGSPEASQFFAAYSVMQGRDHGLPGYESFRSWCGLPKVKSFQDLRGILRSDVDIKKLEQLYGTISAMDLVTAGLLEAPTDGSLLGPTFACLISEQFRRMKLGDRFWYESDLPPLSFSRDQLREIQKVTLAGMICANSGVNRLQPRVFLSEDDFLNAPVFCVNLPHLSLEPWRELEPPEVVVPSELLESSIALARNDLAERTETEKRLVQDRRTADPKGPIGTAYSFHAPSKAACQVANVSLMLEFATRELSRQLTAEGHDLSFVVEAQRKRKKRQIDNFIPTGADFNQIFVGDRLPFPAHLTCPENDDTGPCDPKGAFRSYSGYCNNLQKPSYGKSLTPFNRLLASSYEDGISDPRASSVTGRPLPSPRIVSSFIHSDVSRLHNRYSMMMMQFGQFLDHDITFTPVHRGFQDSLLDCRDCSSAQTVHPECFPIPVPQNDPYYPPVNLSTGVPMCIPLVRSLPGQTRLGPREQLNQNTAFLDGSQVYGQNSCDARKLRAFLGGRLNVTAHPGRGKDLLPQTHGIAECKSPSSVCFVGGDTRPSEQPGLATIHTIFLREHNRIAAELNRVNPHWGDEQTYQTARKIVIAKIQHVTFNEFLPRVLGWNAIKLYELDLQAQGYYNGYDVKCNPGALNEFGAAAFRFGHSLIRPQLHRYDTNYRTLEPFLQLRENFNNPDKIYDVNMIDEIMRGLLSTPMESLDQFVTREVTNHLFEDQRNQYSGLDLVAINVQRARDHGIRPYNDYRVICNLKRAQDFDDLQREIPLEIIERYKQIYAHVDDIDLFTVSPNRNVVKFSGGSANVRWKEDWSDQHSDASSDCSSDSSANNMIDEIMRGLLSTPMESLDQFVTREVTNHLFEDQRNQYSGLDLVAINVQRARDHGIRPYNDYRVICNLKRAQDFDDLQREIPLEIIERYKQIYAHVDDIDLFTENLNFRARTLQFNFRSKSPVSLNSCMYLLHVPGTKPETRNPRLECHDLPVVNIEAWKEPPPSVVNGNGCLIGGNVIQLGQAALPSPCVQCVCTTEGANCQSLRITNCQQLLATQPREAVIADRVCRAQCGQLIQEQASGRTGRALAGAGRPSNVFRPPPPPPQAQAQALRQENQAPLRSGAFNRFRPFFRPGDGPFRVLRNLFG